MKLLEIKDLKTYFYTEQGCAKAVDGVSYSLDEGKVLGVVGESGSGKSVTNLSVMGLVDKTTGRYEGGEILFRGRNILDLPEEEMCKIRGNHISMIFQEPMTSLNPVFTVGYQIIEAIRLHTKLSRKEAADKAVEMLRLVGIPEPEVRINDYPHQMSGGMRQRVMIAMALCCNPDILIADEPTTALDVTIQAQILDLLNRLKKQLNMAIIFITHDLGVISEMADDVVVMYAGEIVEKASVKELFDHPLHPYTQGLMNSLPDINVETETLQTLEGIVPSLYDMPSGCRFGPRCPYFEEQCGREAIPLVEFPDGRQVRCRRCTHE